MVSKRINKAISDSGFCSRRGADKLIFEGRVSVNGAIVEVGFKVGDSDKIFVDGNLIGVKAKRVFLAFNKPVGVTCTTDLRDKDNIIDFLNYPKRIFPIGRLDKMSEGLIFLTNDGDIVNKILRAGNNHKKEYVVSVREVVTKDFIFKMSNGVRILGEKTKKCEVSILGDHSFRIILVQGLNRQIRRMCETLGFRVTKLKRVKIMGIWLNNLAPGKFRDLDFSELSNIDKLVLGSSGTEEMSL